MPTLNENLLSIYNTKLEIKDAIGTNSDVFSEYPDLIRGLRNGIVPTGTYSYSLPLDMYGPYEVGIASYAYISISQGESSAYINSNGSFKPSDFGYVAITKDIVVNVPGPSGNMVIETPGNYNVSSYASVTADFEIPGDVVTVTENGNYYVKSWVYAYVSVPQSSVSGSYSITANGDYDISSYSYAYVNVSGGGEPNLLVTPWSGSSVQSTGTTYIDIEGLFDQALLNGLQCTIDTVESLVDAQYNLNNTLAWHSCGDGVVDISIDSDPEAGGYENAFGWLKIDVDSSLTDNGTIRVQFDCTASNSAFGDFVECTSNHISFEMVVTS